MKKVIVCFLLLSLSFCLHAQVPVSREPRHHPVFENKKVRLLNVLLPAGDTTQYHLHSTPSVFIGFTKTNTTSQLMGQPPVDGISTGNSIWFENLKAPNTKIHRVWNRDTSTYHVMDIELLSNDSGFVGEPLTVHPGKLLIDTPWARAYQIQLTNTQPVNLQKHAYPFVLVSLDRGEITMTRKSVAKKLLLEPGSFFWIEPNEPISIKVQSAQNLELVLVEIR